MQTKNRMLAIRISELDLNCIRAKASRADLTMTDYITQSALGKKIIVINGLDRASSELKYIGNKYRGRHRQEVLHQQLSHPRVLMPSWLVIRSE